MGRRSQTVEKASQSFLRKQKIKLKTFSAGACTWQQTAKNWRKAPKGIFDKLRTSPWGDVLFLCRYHKNAQNSFQKQQPNCNPTQDCAKQEITLACYRDKCYDVIKITKRRVASQRRNFLLKLSYRDYLFCLNSPSFLLHFRNSTAQHD